MRDPHTHQLRRHDNFKCFSQKLRTIGNLTSHKRKIWYFFNSLKIRKHKPYKLMHGWRLMLQLTYTYTTFRTHTRTHTIYHVFYSTFLFFVEHLEQTAENNSKFLKSKEKTCLQSWNTKENFKAPERGKESKSKEQKYEILCNRLKGEIRNGEKCHKNTQVEQIWVTPLRLPQLLEVSIGVPLSCS